MSDTVPALIGAPYRSPRCRVGKPIHDLLHGDTPVVAISDAPVPWPLVRSAPTAPAPLPAMTAELRRAVETESVEAIVYHWGVSRWTVRRWRHALKVPRFNPGTQRLWRELASVRLGKGARPLKLDDGRRAELARRARAGESLAALAREYGVSRQYAGQLRSPAGLSRSTGRERIESDRQMVPGGPGRDR